MAFKKIEKEFCLSDDSVNVYGYRLLTSGLQLERFTPPIGFLMHDRDKGVAVRWEDLQIRDGCLYGKPCVNETLFPGLAQQVEDGFYAAASVGHIVALKMTDDPVYQLEGQTGPTVLEWFPRECSIVDIPGNYNAIARLYDEADNLLHDLTDKRFNMDKKTIEVEALGLPNLSAEASAEDVRNAISDLVAKAARTDKAEQALADLKATVAKEKVEALIASALADHRLTAEAAEALKKDYAENPEGLKALLDKMPVQQTIADRLETKVPEKYLGKTWQELYASGELEGVKKNYPDYYRHLKERC